MRISKRFHVITLYTQHGSKLCELSREYFRNEGYEFNEIDIIDDKEAQMRVMQLTNQPETPIAVIDGRVIKGYSPEIYNIALAQDERQEMGE